MEIETLHLDTRQVTSVISIRCVIYKLIKYSITVLVLEYYFWLLVLETLMVVF